MAATCNRRTINLHYDDDDDDDDVRSPAFKAIRSPAFKAIVFLRAWRSGIAALT